MISNDTVFLDAPQPQIISQPDLLYAAYRPVAIIIVGFKKVSRYVLPLPQYEAKLWTGGDSGGARSRKLHLERAATLPVRPQSHMVLPRGFEPPVSGVKGRRLNHLSMGAYQRTVYTVVSSTITFGSGLGYETRTHTSCDGTF